jgi:glycosyltransferase involved in cell wall biosynthesis
MEKLVSIIIPIYMVEKYLSECVDSVLGQTYRNLEVILVDDRSPDGCPAICDEYAVKDPRVTVIHREVNGGLSVARNTGYAASKGDYIWFVDSDDYVEKDAVETLLGEIMGKRADFVFFDLRKFYEDTGMVADAKRLAPSAFDGTGVVLLNEAYRKNSAAASVCAKFIDRRIIDRLNLSFIEGITSEDRPYSFFLFMGSDNVRYIPKVLYHYRIRAGSIITNPPSKRHFTGRHTSFKAVFAYYEKLVADKGRHVPDNKKAAANFLNFMFAGCVSTYAALDGQNKSKLRSDVAQLRHSMRKVTPKSRKTRILLALPARLYLSLMNKAWRRLKK